MRLSLILPIALLPALAACGPKGPPPLPPLSHEALAAVADKPGADRQALARAVDKLFTDPAAAETRAVVVMHGGKIVAERYEPGYGRTTRFVSWSMAKSVTGVMIGMLVSDGRLRLDEPVPIPAWQRPGDPRGEITLRQLLQMRSGLRHSEAISPPWQSDEVRMLFLDGRDDMARYAEDAPLAYDPGTHFEYSTSTSVILADLAARVLAPGGDAGARRNAVATYLRTRLFQPAGMTSMVPEFDAAGTFIGGSLIHGTARDWARFGQFLLDHGSVDGAQIVPRQWIDFMTTPSPTEPDYGAQIWLNRQPGNGQPLTLFPARGPKDLFSAVGHLGQYVMVSPRQKLVVVRLGKTQDDKLRPVVEHLADLVHVFD